MPEGGGFCRGRRDDGVKCYANEEHGEVIDCIDPKQTNCNNCARVKDAYSEHGVRVKNNEKNSPLKYWREIRKEADGGRVYRYYKFVVLVTLLLGSVIMIYVYFFAGISQLLKDIIFFILMVTIGITNYQSLWVATDYAKRSEPMAEVYQKGGVFIGTIMKRLETHEIELAKKEKRKPKSTEEIAQDFGDDLLIILKSVAPIQKQLKDKGVTIEQVFEFVQTFMRHSDDFSLWAQRFKKLMPLFDTIAQSVEKIDEKALGRILGDKVAQMLDDYKKENPQEFCPTENRYIDDAYCKTCKKCETGISISEYFEGSKEGKWCAIVGCPENPTETCPTCGAKYCRAHVKTHFHVVAINKLEAVK